MLSMVVSLNTSAQKTLTPEVKKDLIELSSTFIDAYIAAAREIATIKSKFILVESGAIMKKEALDEYNNGFGKIFQPAKTYDEAKKLIEAKGFVYMEIKGLMAYSQACKDKAEEKKNK